MTMPELEISLDHNDFRLAGSIACADAGPANSRLQFFSTVWDGLGADPGAAPLVEMVLA